MEKVSLLGLIKFAIKVYDAIDQTRSNADKSAVKNSDEDEIRALELQIEEQRRDHDCLERLYESAKVKNITFLAAGLALLGYLYANPPESAVTLKDKLFIPDEPYGVIIYGLSLAIFLAAISMLLVALKPRKWSTAFDEEQEDIMLNNTTRYLRYVSKRYKRAARINVASYTKKQSLLDISFIPLLLGGILLLLLKTFGG